MFRSKDDCRDSDKEAISSASTTPSPPSSSVRPTYQRSRASSSSSSSSTTVENTPRTGRTAETPCHLCGGPSTRLVTRYSNRTYYGGRPYFKCLPCNKFLAFADERGINSSNPRCYCDCGRGRQGQQGQLSRLQMNGQAHPRLPRGLHFVCATGRCGFYKEVLVDDEQRQNQRQLAMPEQLVESFARLGII